MNVVFALYDVLSFVLQGVRHLDHFGFISRETTLTGGDCYAGYIFRCQTERVVRILHCSLFLSI